MQPGLKRPSWADIKAFNAGLSERTFRIRMAVFGAVGSLALVVALFVWHDLVPWIWFAVAVGALVTSALARRAGTRTGI
jgi:hypothetical protein